MPISTVWVASVPTRSMPLTKGIVHRDIKPRTFSLPAAALARFLISALPNCWKWRAAVEDTLAESETMFRQEPALRWAPSFMSRQVGRGETLDAHRPFSLRDAGMVMAHRSGFHQRGDFASILHRTGFAGHFNSAIPAGTRTHHQQAWRRPRDALSGGRGCADLKRLYANWSRAAFFPIPASPRAARRSLSPTTGKILRFAAQTDWHRPVETANQINSTGLI